MESHSAKDFSAITQEKAHKAAESLGLYSGRVGSIWDKTKNAAFSAWEYHAVRTFSSIFGILSGIPLLVFSSYAFLATTGITGFAIVAWLLVVAGSLGLGLVALVPVLFFTFCVSAIVLGGYIITRGIYNTTCSVISYFIGIPPSHGMKRHSGGSLHQGAEKTRGLAGGAGDHGTYAEVAKSGIREHDKNAATTTGGHSGTQPGGGTGGNNARREQTSAQK